MRSGKPAYREAFGRGFWEDLEAHPEIAASFDALMGTAGHGVPDWHVLVDPADWESVRTVVDVGGGTGALLAEILRARPEVRGTLVDLPGPVARSSEIFQAAGVDPLVLATNHREYRTTARRPQYSALSNAKMERLGLQPMPPVAKALEAYFADRRRPARVTSPAR